MTANLDVVPYEIACLRQEVLEIEDAGTSLLRLVGLDEPSKPGEQLNGGVVGDILLECVPPLCKVSRTRPKVGENVSFPVLLLSLAALREKLHVLEGVCGLRFLRQHPEFIDLTSEGADRDCTLIVRVLAVPLREIEEVPSNRHEFA